MSILNIYMKNIICLFFLQFFFLNANACFCKVNLQNNIKESKKVSSKVVIGFVEEKIYINPYDYILKLNIEKYLKGESKNSNNLYIFSSDLEEDCGFQFITGEKYLLFLTENNKKMLQTTRCEANTPTSLLSDEDYEKYLN